MIIDSGLKLDKFELVGSNPSRETAVIEHCGGILRPVKREVRDIMRS